MRFAILSEKQIEPAPGGRATCNCCGKQLIAKCGKINIWHWSHYPRKHCDNWWENETEWHRKWKNYFPASNQEVVQFDQNTGEKHIADIKTQEGLVVELQNSPMNEHELLSREQFYKNMIWVVNGIPFKKQFFIFPFKLPTPHSDLANDLYIVRQPYLSSFPYNAEDREGRKYMKPLIARKSNIEKKSGNGFSYQVIWSTYVGKDGIHDPSDEFQKEIDINHTGHYYFSWKNRREVWFRSSKPVFIDFGDDNIYSIEKLNQEYYCVRILDKESFVDSLGGSYTDLPR